jgi:hypothetical protein
MSIASLASSLLGSSTTSGDKALFLIKMKTETVQLKCDFNPEKLTISRSNQYSEKPAPTIQNKSNTIKQFSGGKETLKMDLLFDTSMEKIPKDVNTKIAKLLKAYYPDVDNADSKTGSVKPPVVVFMWGSFSFEGVVTDLSQDVTLFANDGMALRTKIGLTLERTTDISSQKGQNPTSGAKPGKVHVVSEGDRLDLIANKYYESPKLWRYIADVNDIDNPRQLTNGMVLTIPPAPTDF